MKEKATVRYLGQRTLADGTRFDFSVALIGEGTNLNTIEASADLFRGQDLIAIQEAARHDLFLPFSGSSCPVLLAAGG